VVFCFHVFSSKYDLCFQHFESRSTIFGLKTSSFWMPHQHPNSSADCARELFKGSNGSASLVDCTRKKMVRGADFFLTDVIGEVVLGSFWLVLPDLAPNR